MKSHTQQVITLSDVVRKIPSVAKKLPHIADGLRQVYLRRSRSPTGLAYAFEQAVEKNPQGHAILYENQQITYDELNQWANRIAHYFLSIGTKKGDVVAVMIENRPELLAVVLGLAKIGVISALVNTAQTHKTLIHSINLVEPIALIVGEEVRHAVENIRDDLKIDHERFYWFADTDTRQDSGKTPSQFANLAAIIPAFASFNPPMTQLLYGRDGLFYVYTSGTTGLPKAAIFNNDRWTLAYGTYGHILNLNQDDVLYSTLPLYHATAIVACWSGAIAGQAAFAIRRKFSQSAFWDDIRRFDASAFGYVGELCRYLLEAPPSEQDRQHRVKKMIGNGMRPTIWNEFKHRFGIDEVMELYASSEGNIGFGNIFNFDNTVGFSPLPYAVIQWDREQQQPIRDELGFCQKVKVGETGLLLGKITRHTPFAGYTDEDKTNAVIIHDVFKPNDRYFNTGDLVRQIGFRHVQFVDRLGDTFRWKGENVSTTEVENILLSYSGISAAVVYGVTIPQTEGRAGMAALTITDQNQQRFIEGLFKFLRQQLPAYAIPLFVRILPQIEATATFKHPKHILQKEGYQPEQTLDSIYVCLPGSDRYQLLTEDILQQIQRARYRF